MSRETRLNRRRFLTSAAFTATGLTLAACGAQPPSTSDSTSNVTSSAGISATSVPTVNAAPAASAAPAVSTGSTDKVVIWSPGDNGTVADWNTDPILQEVAKATNTTIEMVKVDPDTYTDKLNAAIASGQIPDIIATINHDNRTLISQWVRDGVVAPFEGAVAAAMPNVLKQYEKNPTLNELKIDDKIYTEPIEWGFSNYPNVGLLHVRKDLLDKYGMQPPQTFDQYFAFLKASKQDGASGVIFDGKDGIGSALNSFAGAVGLPIRGWVKAGSGWEYYAIQPALKDALLLFRRMVADELVDPASWESNNQARDKYVAGQGSSLIFNGGGHIGRIQNDMDKASKGAKEWMLPALDAGKGSRGYTSEPQFWGVTFIANLKGNNPVAAARVLDYLSSNDGYKLTTFGIPGRDYEGSGDNIKLLPQRANDGFPTAAGNTGAHPLAAGIVSWQPQELQDWALLYDKDQAFKDWYKQMWNNQGQYQIKSYGLLTTSPEWNNFQSTGSDLQMRAYLDSVKAASDDEAAARFDQFVSEWKSAGGAKAQEEMSGVLAKMYG